MLATIAGIALAVFITQASAADDQGSATQVSIKNLRPGHPRLIVTDEGLAEIRQNIERYPLARKWYEAIRKSAERTLKERPVEYKLIGPRLLSQSRRCLNRIYVLALVYRLEGDRRFAERAKKELFAAAAFKDWHPSHFLDTAEMTHAFGIGYDWLYDVLTPKERDVVRTAIVEKGLKPAQQVYERRGWWSRSSFNWNQVCNGGITIGALAVGDEEPQLAQYILDHAVESIKLAMARYAPDGGWDEGPGYWNYATSYNVFFLAALDTALGTDAGLLRTPGFAEAGMFRVYAVGPLNRVFNFADCGEQAGRAPEMFWLAKKFNRPIYAWHERNRPSSPTVHDVIWFDPRGEGPKASGLPLDKKFERIAVAFFRSAWEDPKAVFVGFKGGDNRANHSHLDLGTFVLDALGYRWAVDLGADNYNLPGYFGKQRFTYYRLRTEGHNTLLLDGKNQDPRAKAPLVAFRSTPDRAFAIADLSAAYRPAGAKRVWRGVALLNRTHVLVVDEIETAQPVEVLWAMHTPARIELAGANATLSQGEARLLARILAPQGAQFEVRSANPPKPQAQQPHIKKLVVRLPEKVSRCTVAVLLSPYSAKGKPPQFTPALSPLSAWAAEK